MTIITQFVYYYCVCDIEVHKLLNNYYLLSNFIFIEYFSFEHDKDGFSDSEAYPLTERWSWGLILAKISEMVSKNLVNRMGQQYNKKCSIFNLR